MMGCQVAPHEPQARPISFQDSLKFYKAPLGRWGLRVAWSYVLLLWIDINKPLDRSVALFGFTPEPLQSTAHLTQPGRTAISCPENASTEILVITDHCPDISTGKINAVERIEATGFILILPA